MGAEAPIDLDEEVKGQGASPTYYIPNWHSPGVGTATWAYGTRTWGVRQESPYLLESVSGFSAHQKAKRLSKSKVEQHVEPEPEETVIVRH